MGGKESSRGRVRGNVEELGSGAQRVRVYAGIDPLTKRPHYLREVIPPGPDQKTLVRKTLTRLQCQVDERRHTRTNATVDQLVTRYLDHHTGERSTLTSYWGYVTNHVRPLIGGLRVGAVDAEVLDTFYAELRRCRTHCDGPVFTEHRTKRPHMCDDRCGPHRCKPLSASAVRQVHFVLSGAFQRAVRWKWLSVNPVASAEPPSATAPDPHPPSAAEAARIVNAAWSDPAWGVFVWLSMRTGSRRGEMCAVRWSQIDWDNRVLELRKSIGQSGSQTYEKDTKTHQKRRIVLDEDTMGVLADHHRRCEQEAAAVGCVLRGDGFVFSRDPDGRTEPKPNTATQRFRRLAARLNIDATLHSLRHYSATELIAAGVDIRTVAGRLGHGSGGATTLRVYTAWVAESDQRAAAALTARLPGLPILVDSTERAKTDPTAPYEKVAADLRARILDGTYTDGQNLPSQKEIARDYAVAVSTAHRSLQLLAEWGMAEVRSGCRAIALRPKEDAEVVEVAEDTAAAEPVASPPQPPPSSPSGSGLLDLEIVHGRDVIRKVRTEGDPNDGRALRQLLLDAVRRNGDEESRVGDYELNVRYAGERGLVTTFVVCR